MMHPETSEAMDAGVVGELRAILRSQQAAKARCEWRLWASRLMRQNRLSVPLLASLWREVLIFDPVLADYISSPIGLPERTVVVAGSGKETFKSFNVSTAASILAASVGVPVVKGVARSVSAVSGAADVLGELGVPVVAKPEAVGDVVESGGIAFVSYAAFCPIYASRYDGVFTTLNPFSYFMPVAVLAGNQTRFVLGIADSNVLIAAETVRAVRPDLATGFVVATTLDRHGTIDEAASVGITHLARVRQRGIRLQRRTGAQPDARWRRAVAHRDTHAANARIVVDALSPTGDPARTDLVEANASLIMQANCRDDLTYSEALAQIREARREGRAWSLLQRLQNREDITARCTEG